MTARVSLAIVVVCGLAGGTRVVAAPQTPSRQVASQSQPPVEQPPKDEKPGLLDTLDSFSDIDDLELDELLNVTVSIAAGRAQRLDEAPSIVTVITDEEMRRNGVRTVAEALQLTPGIIVLKDNLGRGRIAIRGVSSGLTSGSSENVLVLFNGHRLNDEVSGGATIVNLDIPTENVKKIEIIRGPGSALFGANAFLGTINIVSYTADTFRGVEVSADAGSFNTGQGRVLFGRTFGPFGVSGFVQLGTTNGASLPIPADAQTSSDQALSGFGLPPASLAPGRSMESRRPVHASFTVSHQRVTVNGRVADDDAGGFIGVLDNLGPRTRLRTNQVILDASYRHPVGSQGDVTATASYTRSVSSQFLEAFPPRFALPFPDGRVVGFPDGILIDARVGSRRVGGQVAFNARPFVGNTMTAGLAVENESTIGLSSRGNFNPLTFTPRASLASLPPVVRDSSRRIVGLFVQDTWYPIPQIGITAGVRWDHYDDFGDAVNPRAGVVWQLPRSLNLKMLYGHAFRAPSFTELFFEFPGLSGNQALRPATIDTFEAALGYKRRDLRISGNFYANVLRDAITIERPVSLFFESARYVNSAGINTTGFELDLRRFFGRARSLEFGYAYQRSKDQTTGLRVPDIPSQLGTAGISLDVGEILRVTPRMLFRSSMPRAAIDPRASVRGAVLLNLTVQARQVVGPLDVALTIDNVGDRMYADPSPFNGVPGDYPRPGRRYQVTARWGF